MSARIIRDVPGVQCIVGIDPGLAGGVAFYFPSSPAQITAEDMPVAGGEVDVDTLVTRIKQMAPTFGVVEKVHSMPHDGHASAFKFGGAYMAARASLTALGVPTRLVSPQAWKAHFRLPPEKEAKKAKDQARSLAIQLWPGAGCFARVKDHGRADAALIARYGALLIKMEEAA